MQSSELKMPLDVKKKESFYARLLGSGSAGVFELLVFHPVDTVSKRLMSNQASVFLELYDNPLYFHRFLPVEHHLIKDYLIYQL